MASMPRLTKYRGAHASSSRLPEANPWYACTGNLRLWQLDWTGFEARLSHTVRASWLHGLSLSIRILSSCCIGNRALASSITYLRSCDTADAPFCSVTDAHHIKEGKVVLFNAEVGYLLPLLARGVDACGVVRTACGSDQCVMACRQCTSFSSQLWLLANEASLSKHMHYL